MKQKKCNFTLEHYTNTLKKALSLGYTISKLEDYPNKIKRKKIIFLRHDVDFDLKLALRMAVTEHKLGIKSTYFIRMHAPYNIFFYPNYKALRDIASMGHEIGLHHEGNFSILFNENEKDMIRREKAILEMVANTSIKGISSHESLKSNLSSDVNPDILNNLVFAYDAYSPKFTKDIKYISDSAARWHEGCMCGFIASETPKLCVLTHPFWWYEKSALENY
ncbi:hypothetical protein HYX06_00295 [Candidatus Woesearchaeota archaeon]|nr:hypothetical protein [Candidatus Woesearchaeota archaeon]